MKPALESLQKTAIKYQKYVGFIYTNMRLILLLMFAALAGYLVLRINTLVNQEPVLSQEETTTGLSASPDKDVLSAFNELQSRNINVTSQFEDNRQNPF